MKALIVHAHPDSRAFASALKHTAADTLAARGHEVQVSDLYEMRFKASADTRDFTHLIDETVFDLQAEQYRAAREGTFAPDILAEQRKLVWADYVLFTFPLWWYSVPAILKGWIDRVLAHGFAYGTDADLNGRRAMLVMTTGGPHRSYTVEMRAAVNDMLEHLQYATLHFCGFEVLPPYAVYGADNASKEQQQRIINQFRQMLATLEAIPPMAYR